MNIHLRQLCLVASELQPVVTQLTDVFDIEVCYTDPAVEKFGLENALLPIGTNFIEVVAPVRADTAAGRHLQRRGGDGGYMVITHIDSLSAFEAIRSRALADDIRIAYETTEDDWKLCQLHPGDMQCCFLEIEWDEQQDPTGHWHPAGGSGWRQAVNSAVTTELLGAGLQCNDPSATSKLWSNITGVTLQVADGNPQLPLQNAKLTFASAEDGRGPGLGDIYVGVKNIERVLARADEFNAVINDRQVRVGGVRWHLHTA